MIPWWLIPSGELLERYLPAVYVDEAALGILPARVSLLNRDPHPDDAAVPRLWWVRVQAVHPSADLDPASARLWVDGVLVYDGATFAAGWDREGRSWARTGSEMDHPAALQLVEVCALNEVPLASEATVTVRFAVDVDGGGDPVDESWSFAVEDWTPPEIVGVRAVDERTIDVTWDDAMRMAGDGDPADALTASAYVFTRTGDDPYPAAAIVATSAAEVDARTVRVGLDWEQSPGRGYAVAAAGAGDDDGNASTGSPFAFAGYAWDAPAARRWSIWEHMPRIARRKDATRDLRRLTAVWQEVFDLLLHEVDTFPRQFDPDRCRDDLLDLLLYDAGNPFWQFDLDAAAKRRLLRILPTLLTLKGTATGIEQAALFFLELSVAVLPAAANPLGWILGESELGEGTELFPSAARERRTFDIEVARELTDGELAQLVGLARYMKPKQMHLGRILQTAPTPEPEGWDLGVSELGESTVLW